MNEAVIEAAEANGRDVFRRSLRTLATDLPRLRPAEIGIRLARLRGLAETQGLWPAMEVADGMAAALRRDRAGTLLAAWIGAIDDAASCPPAHAAAAPLLMATVGVRLA